MLKNKQTRASKVFITAVFCALLCLTIAAPLIAQTPQSEPQKLSDGENALAQSSKAAILGAGISEAYFKEHFKLQKVIDQTGDRRVIWKFQVNEFETILNDAVGFYTDKNGKTVNVHSIQAILLKAHDIKPTIDRKRAEQLMTQCIGQHTAGDVIFQADSISRRAALIFTASTDAQPFKESEEDKRKEKILQQEKERAAKSRRPMPPTDSSEKKGGSPLKVNPPVTGFINLETGACTKGLARAGAEKPLKN